MQRGDAGGCAGTARRAVDLTVGEDRDIALVQLTGVRRAEAVDEDRAVDARQAFVLRMHGLRMAGQCRLDLAPEVDEPSEALGRDLESETVAVDEGIERPAPGEVDGQPTAARGHR